MSPEEFPEAAPEGSAGDQAAEAGTPPLRKGPGGKCGIADYLKNSGLLGKGRGGLDAALVRHRALGLLNN